MPKKKSVCSLCRTTFPLSASQTRLVNAAQRKGQTFVMIECSGCGLASLYAPEGTRPILAGERPRPLRCPVSHCSGMVSFIPDGHGKKPFWGCGECGSVWFKQENLFAKIEAIVKRFPYRRKCYTKRRETWVAAGPCKEAPNYEELVEAEPADKQRRFKRG